MSSTSADLGDLSRTIETSDNEWAVSILEARMLEGLASESERLLCGVLLLLPPLGGYETASKIFGQLFHGSRGFEAAVWDAYRFSVLLPDGAQHFEEILQSNVTSAIAAHMLAMTAAARGDLQHALELNRRSRVLRLFPFNIVEGLKSDPDLSAGDRSALWQTLNDLVISRLAEGDENVCSVEGALQRRWENLIVGTRISSELWGHYEKMFMR